MQWTMLPIWRYRFPVGGTLPLSAIAKIDVRQGAARVGREGGGRMVAVKANLLGRDQGGFVAEAMDKVQEQVKLPPGLYHDLGRTVREPATRK